MIDFTMRNNFMWKRIYGKDFSTKGEDFIVKSFNFNVYQNF